jgi:type 1 glutamine amidotransferase
MKKVLTLIFALGLAAAAFRAGAQDEPGFTNMFNGKDLTGWVGSPDLWSVRDGAITGQTTKENPAKENTFLIWTNGQPGDFEMRCSFRIEPNNSVGFANSGIQYRSKVVKPSYWVVAGYQADMEAGPNYTGGLYEEKMRGILASRGQKVVIHSDGQKEITGAFGSAEDLQKEIHNGGWNDYVIIAKGNHLQQFINGKQMIDVVDEQKDVAASFGVIALQLHAGQPGKCEMTVQFKDLRIKMEPSGKKIVFVAGPPSHGPGEHEYRAGCMLLQKCLRETPGIQTVIYSYGWPTDEHAFDGADAVVLSMDGGSGHPALQDNHLEKLGQLMDKGVGLACIHYAVEPTKDRGESEFLQWMGGAFEVNWSVNPTWTANFATLPDHPITRGVKPFEIHDEWYFHMRFAPDMKGVTPILSAVAPDSTMDRPDGEHSGNPAVRDAVAKHEPQIMAWAFERPDGGRGFGFTGAHYHKNWGDDNFRKIVLNAILWIAKVDVPANGVESTVSEDDLKANLDDKRGK